MLREYREFERWSTTVVNAYVTPLMARYLSVLEQRLGSRRLSVMQSNGGSIAAATARAAAVRTILSGPAAGVVGALIGGVITDRVFARTGSPRTRLTIMGVALLLSGAALIPIFAAPSLTVSVTFISIGVGLGFITGGIWWVAAIDAVPAQPGVAAGFADASFALSGIVAPSVMGFTISSTGSFSSGFVVMTVLAVIGAGSLLVLPRRERRGTAPVSDTPDLIAGAQ